MEPLPEHMYEEITAEQLVIDIAALSDLTEDEVRQTGVQSNLVALHLQGNVPENRQDLHRLARGLTIIRLPADPPLANAPTTGLAAIDAALGINVRNGTEEPASASVGMLGVLPGPDAAFASSDSVPNAPAPSEPNAAANAVNGPNNWMIETSWTQMTKAERLFLTKGNWHVEWRNPHYAKENALHLSNGQAFEESENENEEPIAFVVFRRTKCAAMRRWVAGRPGGNARMKLENYFNRQFTDHISTFEWEGKCPNDWKWTMEALSQASAGIVRVPMTDPMCVRNLENEETVAANAWNAPKAKANEQASGIVLAQTAMPSALDPGSEIVLRKNAKGTMH
ncbi:unnamed protein product [Symbiodinium sp. CCMP2592]|nr:unnamed protein product [Symbiodinium sp. CCMP2592]